MARQMKDSGVEWIGMIPQNWKLMKLKYVLKPNCINLRVGPFGSALSRADIKEEGYWIYNQRCVLDKNFDYNNICIDENKFRELIGFKVLPNDILVTTRGSIGRVAIVPNHAKEGILHPCIIKFVVDNSLIFNRLIELIFNESDFIYNQILRNSNTTTIEVIYSYTLKEVLLPIIPIEEQKRIVDFLDEKVGEIDSVIAKTKDTIEGYKKYKQAIITETVTRGLSLDVEMKDTGVEWIGKIPKRWNCIKLRYVVKKIGDIDHYMPEAQTQGIPYVMTGDLQDLTSKIDFEKCKKVSYEDFQQLSNKIQANYGDVILARYATIGTASYVDINKDFLISYSCVTIKPTIILKGKFLFYYIKTSAFIEELKKYTNSNTQGNVGIDSLYQAKIILPPIEEQAKIINYLEAKCSEIDKLIAKKEELIRDLESYKKSLIYEYVTGKKEVQ